ncbi:Uncharacterised protein [Pseudomonas putida]|uniref:hypothetical protein n=1 Tax=Pseudomonas putida TaxID=303 RepID=UPI000E029102|nr:hypothetical protein [Pseudomonas putida]SUD75775.1 Uncharacterised protein [Pseudomonas putida]
MSNLTFDPASWRDHGVAFGVACALHAGLAYLLFNLSHTPELAAVPAAVIHTQLVSLPAPVVVLSCQRLSPRSSLLSRNLRRRHQKPGTGRG